MMQNVNAKLILFQQIQYLCCSKFELTHNVNWFMLIYVCLIMT